MNNPRFLFPCFNAVVVMVLMGAVGYYLRALLPWLVAGALGGLLLGALFELLFGLAGLQSGLYRRRALLLALAELPLIFFGVGPFAYALRVSQPNRYPITGAPPADFGAAYEAVTFPGADGVRLAGWYVPPPPGGQDAIIIVLPGQGGGRLDTLAHAEVLYQGGYGLLLYDPRAVGESDGDTQSWGWLDRRDVPYAIDFISQHTGGEIEQVGGVGLSQGAHILLMAMPDEPRLAALWADGLGANRSSDVPPMRDAGETLLVVMSNLVELNLAMIVRDGPAPSSRELLLAVDDRPIQLVAGGADKNEVDTNRFLIDTIGSDNIDLWVVDNAGHVGGLFAARETYAERMLVFFDTALAKE